MSNLIEITLAVQGNGSVPYRVPENFTVGELQELANMNPHLEIRVNSEPATVDTVIPAGATVIATQPVKGGIR